MGAPGQKNKVRKRNKKLDWKEKVKVSLFIDNIYRGLCRNLRESTKKPTRPNEFSKLKGCKMNMQ